MASAVSSMVRPPKKRSSTRRACSGSSCSRRSSASSSATRSIDGDAAGDERLVQRDARLRAAALLRAAGARPLDQDLAHRVRGDRAEVRAVLPALRAILHQPQVGLVDERRRLERLARTLAAQIRRRQPAQLLVDDRQQRVDRLPIVRHHATRSMVTLFITTGVTGRSCRPVGTAADLLARRRALRPPRRTPSGGCRGAASGPRVMKNWLPLVFGPALAIERMPALVVAQRRMELVAELVAGPAGALAEAVAALNHEAVDDAVEDDAVVVRVLLLLAGRRDRFHSLVPSARPTKLATVFGASLSNSRIGERALGGVELRVGSGFHEAPASFARSVAARRRAMEAL